MTRSARGIDQFFENWVWAVAVTVYVPVSDWASTPEPTMAPPVDIGGEPALLFSWGTPEMLTSRTYVAPFAATAAIPPGSVLVNPSDTLPAEIPATRFLKMTGVTLLICCVTWNAGIATVLL